MDINKYSPCAVAEILWGNYIKITIYQLNLVPSFYINVLSAEYSSVFGDVEMFCYRWAKLVSVDQHIWIFGKIAISLMFGAVHHSLDNVTIKKMVQQFVQMPQ